MVDLRRDSRARRRWEVGEKTPSVRCADTSPGSPGEERREEEPSPRPSPWGKGREEKTPSVREDADTSPVRTGEEQEFGAVCWVAWWAA